jgi:hypothetical protein
MESFLATPQEAWRVCLLPSGGDYCAFFKTCPVWLPLTDILVVRALVSPAAREAEPCLMAAPGPHPASSAAADEETFFYQMGLRKGPSHVLVRNMPVSVLLAKLEDCALSYA